MITASKIFMFLIYSWNASFWSLIHSLWWCESKRIEHLIIPSQCLIYLYYNNVISETIAHKIYYYQQAIFPLSSHLWINILFSIFVVQEALRIKYNIEFPNETASYQLYLPITSFMQIILLFTVALQLLFIISFTPYLL